MLFSEHEQIFHEPRGADVFAQDAGMGSTFESVIPMIPAGKDIQAALDVYGRMGFSVVWQDENMAGICRDTVQFNLVRNDNAEWATNASFSIGVTNLAALYDEYRRAPAIVGPLEPKPWGRVEFHIIVAPGVCFQFYDQSLADDYEPPFRSRALMQEQRCAPSAAFQRVVGRRRRRCRGPSACAR